MLPTNNLNDLKNFAKYNVVTTTRQSDGAKLIATRVIRDIALPVRWDVEVTNLQPSASTAPVRAVIELPSTCKLIREAAEQGFGDWFPPIEEMVEMFPLDAKVGDQSRVQRIAKYVEPDTTDYLVD